jgi:hypothetical protein
MANMKALELVKETSIRLGIVPPTTLFPTLSDASKFDTDAQLLLGALKQSVRNSTAIAPFQQLILRYDSPQIPWTGGSEYYFPLPESFDGVVSPLLLTPMPIDMGIAKLDLITFADFMYATGVGFVVYGNQLAARYPYAGDLVGVKFSCFCKTKFSYPTSEIPMSDSDVSLLPDELLILGTVMYYKNYRGLDYQLEMKNYTDYVTHMRITGFDPSIAQPGLYKDVAASNLIRQDQQQQQQQPPQQRG